MKRTLLTTLLCLIGTLAALAQPKHYPADYKDLVVLQANDGAGLKAKGLTELWDEEGQVPYLADADGKAVYTIENPRSLRLKCAYIKERHLLGGMYWEYSCDDAQGTMRTIVAEELLK